MGRPRTAPRSRLAARLAAVAALAAVAGAGGGPACAGGEGDAWGWLGTADARPEAARVSPALSPEEQATALEAWTRHAVTLASSPDEERPAEGAAEAAGVVVTADGVVATSWRVTGAIAKSRGDRWLWARQASGPWVRAIPVGGTWYGDVGLVRLVTPRPAFAPVAWAKSDRDVLGKRVLSVGTALGRGNVIASGKVATVGWFDPQAPSGRVESHDSPLPKSASKEAVPVDLYASDDLATRGGLGSGVFTPTGECAGLVTAPDPSRPAGERVHVHAADYLRPLVERLLADGRFAPPDLGFHLGASSPSGGAAVPVDVARARAAKQKGGAVVTTVAEGGPAYGTVWPGDVVLSVAGKPVFCDVPESMPSVFFALKEDQPTEVVLWRGGKRASVSITPRAATDVASDPQAAHDAEGYPLLTER